MGFMVFVGSDTKQQCPLDFAGDSKDLATVLIIPDAIGAVESALDLKLSRLRRTAPDDALAMDLDDLIAEIGDEEAAAAEFANQQRLQRRAWQRPAKLLRQLDALLVALDGASDAINAHANELDEVGVAVGYVAGDGFRRDLTDLRAIVAWHVEHGAEKVRITIG